MWEGLSRRSGECEVGDLFILASDALACWFLTRGAAGAQPWESLGALDRADWEGWVDGQRRAGLMRNDDTTMVALEVAGD